jgi:hypothetical protein
MKIFSPRSRADRKTFLDSAGPLRDPHWIIDVLRCSIVVDTEEQLLVVADRLSAKCPEYRLVRLKNRFAEPLFNGYRDALYSMRVQVADGVWHTAEVQVHLAQVLFHKERSHHYYGFFRILFLGNVDAVEIRMNVLQALGNIKEGDNFVTVVNAALCQTDCSRLESLAEIVGENMMALPTIQVPIMQRLV